MNEAGLSRRMMQSYQYLSISVYAYQCQLYRIEQRLLLFSISSIWLTAAQTVFSVFVYEYSKLKLT